MIFVPIAKMIAEMEVGNEQLSDTEHLSKRQKTDDASAPMSSPVTSVDANSFITLIFVDFCKVTPSCIRQPASECQYHYHKPTYTHQVFDEEKINFLSETTNRSFTESRLGAPSDVEVGTERNEPGLLIYINCNDLTHYVTMRSIALKDDREALITKMESFLPPCTSYQESEDGDLSLPVENRPRNTLLKSLVPGKVLASFAVEVQSKRACNDLSFELFLASDKDSGARLLLQRAEKIAIWHIETADSVDFSDERWEVINLYNVHSSGSSSGCFAGYMTLFTFNNPFLGSKIRVCQALVLPHMQGLGLGREMLLAVYNLASSRSSVVEVTVEDPAPAFERLRDAVDCEWVLRHLYRENNAPQSLAINHEFFVMVMKDVIAESAGVSSAEEKERCKLLKLTPAQTSFAYEALQYSVLVLTLMAPQDPPCDTHGGDAPSASSLLSASPDYKAFRLRVKRRILNSNKHFKSLPLAVMQKSLEDLFEELQVRYKYCLEPIKRIYISVKDM